MDIIISLIKVIVIPVIILNLLPLMIWMERKGAAYFQDRRGPNRAHIGGVRLGGIIHNIADVIKLLNKEEFFPKNANRFYFILAPFITLSVYVITTAVIPFADNLNMGDWTLTFRVSDINVGVLYIFSMVSLAVYGIMLAGWSSGNKFSLLGALRASSQMVSYEIPMGLSIVSIFMLAGSVDLNDIIRDQTNSPLHWNFIRLFPAFVIFLIASFAETNRTPFDLPEGESELVAGFHVEYSSMKFAMFFMGEYVAIVVASAIIVSLFFGGWQIPFIDASFLKENMSSILYNGGWGFSALSLLGGLALTAQFKKGKYKDARDYEVLIFGIPAILVSFLLATFLWKEGFAFFSNNITALISDILVAFFQFATFMAKTLFFCFFFIWVRWTLPRFRYDQLMKFGWKGLIPVSLGTIFATGVYLIFNP